MEQRSGEYDEVNKVLLECELKLRLLQQQGRLTGEGLREFVELSTKVRAEIDRRHRSGPDSPAGMVQRLLAPGIRPQIRVLID